MNYRINIGLAGRKNLTNVEVPKPSEEMRGLEVLEIARALTGEDDVRVLGWAPVSTPFTGVIALEGAMMGCGNTWTREAIKGLASDTVTVRERTLDGLLEAVFTGEIQGPPMGLSCETVTGVTYGLAILIHSRGFVYCSAGNERRMEHHVIDADGVKVFTGTPTQIAKWLQS